MSRVCVCMRVIVSAWLCTKVYVCMNMHMSYICLHILLGSNIEFLECVRVTCVLCASEYSFCVYQNIGVYVYLCVCVSVYAYE